MAPTAQEIFQRSLARAPSPGAGLILDDNGRIPATLHAPYMTYTGNIGDGPPGAAQHGDLWIADLNIYAPTVHWQFVYNAGISDAMKWVFVGGTPAWANEDADVNYATTGAWTLMAPVLTVPRSGFYIVEANCRVFAGAATQFDIGLSGLAEAFNYVSVPAASGLKAGKRWILELTAGASVHLEYFSTASSVFVSEKFLTILPVRVS